MTNKASSLSDVGDLTSGEHVTNKVAAVGDDSVQLARESAAGATERLLTEPLQAPCGMRMRFDNRTVDEQKPALDSPSDQPAKAFAPARERPPAITSVDPLPWTEVTGEIAPRRTTSENPNDRFKEAAQITFRSATHDAIEEGPNESPPIIGEESASSPKHVEMIARTGPLSRARGRFMAACRSEGGPAGRLFL